LRQGENQTWSSPWSLNGVDQTGTSEFDITLGPGSSKKFVFVTDALQTGYLEIVTRTGSPDSIAPFFFYNFLQDGQLKDSTGTAGGEAKKRFWFSVEKTFTVNTGFAYISRSDSGSFEITLTLFDETGNQVQQETLKYEGHLARFFAGPDGIFSNVPDGFIGALLVTSPEDIVLTVLRLEYTAGGFQLTSLPPVDEGILINPKQ
jgi:hypothetical protein